MRKKLLNWLPDLDPRVWLLFAGRMLSDLGSGFTLFYAPIFFADRVGLSETLVGIGIGSGAIAGIFGRIIGGSLADSPRFGRRRTLLFSTAVSALSTVFLALTYNFSLFLVGNLLMGLGIGLYWPAMEAAVADLTTSSQRNEAFALTRLGDSLGLGLGVILGGVLIEVTGAYRLLFTIDGLSFLLFFGILYRFLTETRNPKVDTHNMRKGWSIALSDRPLLIYALVNMVLTTYLAHVNFTLPLYFTNFVPQENAKGFSPGIISFLFAWHVVLTAIIQLPVARRMNRFKRPRVLIMSSLAWGVGFLLVWVTGVAATGELLWAALALGVMAIATAIYMTAASALVVELAPESLRGVYLSVNSLCWAVGYFIGPVSGGWAMDQTPKVAYGFWLAAAFSVIFCIVVLRFLEKTMRRDRSMRDMT